MQRWWLAGMLLFTLLIGHAHAQQLLATRVWPAADYTRVTLEGRAPIAYKFFLLDNPARLVVDLEGVSPGAAFDALAKAPPADDPYIQAIRVGLNRPGVTRLVIDLKTPVKPSLFTLPPAAPYSHRLVVDLYPATPRASDVLAEFAPPPGLATADSVAGLPVVPPVPEASASKDTLALSPSSPAAAAAPDAKLPEARPGGLKPADAQTAGLDTPGANSAQTNALALAKPRYDRLVTIVIDAGHGGEDPGAIGAAGSREKDITLALARKLKARFDREPNMHGVLTRDGDFYVPLTQRVVKARAARADLFMSIHADAFIKPHARGSSVFALSEGSASSVAARWLAKKENAADLIGGVNIDVKDKHLKRTLIDLTQTATIDHSLKLGSAVLKKVGGVNTLHKHHVEQAGFAVLKAPDIPSILVETAFISNPEEEKKLNDNAYQDKLVEAIFSGVKEYLAKHPVDAPARLTRNP